MTVLVTGSGGYLGRHVVALLRESGVEFSTTSPSGADLTDALDVRALLRATAPSKIIHCAAVVPKNGAGYSDGLAAAQSLAMVRNLAEFATCPITFASSMAATYATGGYGRGKLLAERVLLGREHSGDVVIRLPGLFGAPRKSGVLYNAAVAFLTGQPFTLEPQTGPWAAMDVRDAAACMVSGVYDGPTEPMDIHGAVSLVAMYAGIASGHGGTFPELFARRVAELVEWVRQDLAVAV